MGVNAALPDSAGHCALTGLGEQAQDAACPPRLAVRKEVFKRLRRVRTEPTSPPKPENTLP
eukprot:2986301-Pyramimonas_sp.AAC.1